MIDFACRQFRLEEIIKCGLGLTKAEYSVMQFFLKHDSKKFTSTDVSKAMSLDLTTVQKSVKKLYEKGVLERMQKNMDIGGYVFYYQAKNRQEISRLIMDIIHRWVGKVESEIANW